MGLVEVGVGLIPGGGGCKELVARAVAGLPAGIDTFPFVRDVFMNIALGKVSTSAEEARGMGFLDPRDHVSLNRDYLIWDAKQLALAMARVGYKRPRRQTFKLPGPGGAAALTSAVQMMKEAHQASEHDAKIGAKLAWILCGGDVSQRTEVTEQHLLDLEREAFLSLCGEAKTQERIQFMLMNNKPLRN
jgi:3-hydroxyacyl-CoA dehydrogenase